MNQQFGVGFIPYEPEDIVVLKNKPGTNKIDDIRMIQYIKNRKIEFEVQINDKWISADLIEKRIIEPLVHYCKECEKEKVAEEGMICSKCEFAREQ